MSNDIDHIYVSYADLKDRIRAAFVVRGVSEPRAELAAALFAKASQDGIPSHGANYVPLCLEYIDAGWIDPIAEPQELESGAALIEHYDGHFGLGNVAANGTMERAISLANANGIGIATIKNTNHWTRGGHYGWQAAEAGMIGVCWTNTESMMPPWGAEQSRVGNNPLVMAVPRHDGHLVLDMAMSQYSYGRLGIARQRGEKLDVFGGYDTNGQLSLDPAEIESTRRVLPIGFWKGSGLAFMLDILAMAISGGASTRQVDARKPAPGVGCYGVSQVFVAIDPSHFPHVDSFREELEASIEFLKTLEGTGGHDVRYPGEGSSARRVASEKEGIPCDREVWRLISDAAAK